MRPNAYRVKSSVVLAAIIAASCSSDGSRTTAPTPTTTTAIRDDAALFRLVTQAEPFSGFRLFPNADEFTEGRLNGSEAHRPIVRVSVNARAAGALLNGKLPANTKFPDGSIVFKEIRATATAAASTYVVIYKDSTNALAANGWLWAEFSPNGTTGYSINNRGSACTSCHQREQGTQNDLVRTFERQR